MQKLTIDIIRERCVDGKKIKPITFLYSGYELVSEVIKNKPVKITITPTGNLIEVWKSGEIIKENWLINEKKGPYTEENPDNDCNPYYYLEVDGSSPNKATRPNYRYQIQNDMDYEDYKKKYQDSEEDSEEDDEVSPDDFAKNYLRNCWIKKL